MTWGWSQGVRCGQYQSRPWAKSAAAFLSSFLIPCRISHLMELQNSYPQCCAPILWITSACFFGYTASSHRPYVRWSTPSIARYWHPWPRHVYTRPITTLALWSFSSNSFVTPLSERTGPSACFKGAMLSRMLRQIAIGALRQLSSLFDPRVPLSKHFADKRARLSTNGIRA